MPTDLLRHNVGRLDGTGTCVRDIAGMVTDDNCLEMVSDLSGSFPRKGLRRRRVISVKIRRVFLQF